MQSPPSLSSEKDSTERGRKGEREGGGREKEPACERERVEGERERERERRSAHLTAPRDRGLGCRPCPLTHWDVPRQSVTARGRARDGRAVTGVGRIKGRPHFPIEMNQEQGVVANRVRRNNRVSGKVVKKGVVE